MKRCPVHSPDPSLRPQQLWETHAWEELVAVRQGPSVGVETSVALFRDRLRVRSD